MKIVRLKYPQTSQFPPLAAAIGYFDGVHLAHCALITKAGELARMHSLQAAVISFEPDPWLILKPAGKYDYLTGNQEKYDKFASLGVKLTIIIEFNESFAALAPDKFIAYLQDLNVQQLVCGYNFRFGQAGKGSPQDLLAVKDFSTVVIGEIPNISSTNITKLIKKGKIELANRYLGNAYSIKGKVVKGLGNGKKLGFPTANIALTFPYVIPAEGAYLGYAELNGQRYDALINVGKNKTFAAVAKTIEVYLHKFSRDIYGEELRVSFLRYLRPVIKFANQAELVKQLRQDCNNLPKD